MNNTNRIVWNDEKQCFVVASEFAKSRGKSGSPVLAQAIASALLVAGLAAPAIADQAVIQQGLAQTSQFLASLGAPLKSDPVVLPQSVGDTSLHYFSIDDEGDQGGNYNNDGASGANALALGRGATSTGDSAAAVGSDASATGTSAVAFGAGAIANGAQSTSVGAGAHAENDSATALGVSASATGLYSTAAGTSANASGTRALASGYSASAKGTNATALGYKANASAADGVALGSQSVADTAKGIDGYIPATATAAQINAINATKSTLGAVSVGQAATGTFRQITGVAAGTADSDAVNVAQLKASTADAVLYDDSTHNSVTLGGDVYNSTTRAGGTRIKNVAPGVDGGDAVNVDQLTDQGNELTGKGMDFAGNAGQNVHRDLGSTLAITGTATTTGVYSGNNLKTVTDPATGAIQLQMADAPVFTSVTTGNTTIANNGLTIAGGPSVTIDGIDAGSKKITHVAAGDVSATSTDAVNGSQLKQVQDAANAGWTVSDGSGNKANIGPNGKVAFNGDGNVTVNQTGADNDGQLELNLNKNLDLGDTGSVTMGSTVVNSNGLTITGGPSVTVNGIDAGSKKITHVAAGDVSATSTDAVNGSQLKQVQDAVNAGWTVADADGHAANIGPNGKVTFKGDGNVTVSQTGADNDGQLQLNLNKNLDLGDTGSVTMGNTVVNNNGMTIIGGPSITVDGIDAGGKKITHVADGTAPTDAVNVSQLVSATDGVRTHYYSVNDGAVPGSNYDNDGATGANAMAAGVGALASGASSTALGSNAQATTDNSVALGAGSVTAEAKGTAGTTIAGDNYTFAGSAPAGTVSIGSVGQERTITNVAAGALSSDSTDGVNGSQLYATNQAIGKLDGRISTVENAISNISNNNASAGQAGMFQTSADQKTPAPAPTGSNSAAGGAGAVASGNNSLAVGNGAQATADNSAAIGNASVANRANTVSVGSAGNERQITNVAAGTQDTDAVNVNQLKSSTAGVVKYDTNADGSTNYNSVTLGGDPTIIHNVKAGSASTDAVNVGQLNDAMNSTQNWAKNYTDQKVNQMGRKASAGTAAALATANVPQAYQPNQSSMGVGIGNYQGQSAISIGVSTITESGRYILKASATGSQQNGFGVGVGAGMVW